MLKSYADLHIHTNCSDGTFLPEETVRYAHKKNLTAISITDHDTINGIASATKEGNTIGIEVIPGIELSTELNIKERSEMHILGYYIDLDSKELQKYLLLLQKKRHERAYKIYEKLINLGINLSKEPLLKITAQGGNIGRLHIAKLLIEEGFVKNISEAFQKYLGFEKPAYVPKFKLSPVEGIKIIKEAGGIPVLAHPYYAHYSNQELIKTLIEAGLKGLEVWHTNHPLSSIETFLKISKDFGLITTGGSDCHGPYGKEKPLIGNIKIPYSIVMDLKNLKKEINSKK